MVDAYFIKAGVLAGWATAYIETNTSQALDHVCRLFILLLSFCIEDSEKVGPFCEFVTLSVNVWSIFFCNNWSNGIYWSVITFSLILSGTWSPSGKCRGVKPREFTQPPIVSEVSPVLRLCMAWLKSCSPPLICPWLVVSWGGTGRLAWARSVWCAVAALYMVALIAVRICCGKTECDGPGTWLWDISSGCWEPAALPVACVAPITPNCWDETALWELNSTGRSGWGSWT